MFVERRKAKRVHCDLSSSVRDYDSVNSWSSSFASIKNISEGGLRLRTHAFILLKDRVGISFNLPNYSRTIDVKVIPAWIAEVPNTKIYDIGVQFIEIDDEDKLAIENYTAAEQAS